METQDSGLRTVAVNLRPGLFGFPTFPREYVSGVLKEGHVHTYSSIDYYKPSLRCHSFSLLFLFYFSSISLLFPFFFSSFSLLFLPI